VPQLRQLMPTGVAASPFPAGVPPTCGFSSASGEAEALTLASGVDVPGGVAAGPAVDVAEGLDDGALDWG
jgi:hypothetical protein